MHRSSVTNGQHGCAALMAGALLLGCSAEEPADACESGAVKGAAVTSATFGRVLDETVAEGIDLDQHQTQEGEAGGCYKQDFTSPEGVFGIDNQFATLLPLIENFVGEENIDALLQGAIANGQLLIMLAVEGVDDPVNDPCVTVLLGAGKGTPLLSNEGFYEPYQTFGFDEEEAPVSRLPGQIVNGVLTAGPGSAVLPVRILDASFNLKMETARVEMIVTEEPLHGGIALSGTVGGGIKVADFTGIVEGLNVGADLVGAVLPLVGGAADLGPDPDGICQYVSAALKITTIQAYIIN